MVIIDLEQQLAALLASPAVQGVLEEIVRRVIREELARAPADDGFMNVEQAARYLSMSPASVRKAVQRGTIPCTHIGRRVRFRRSELVGLNTREARKRASP